MRNKTLMPEFNNRQAAFVDHVLTGCSATVAAQRAGYSERSARQIATRLMSRAAIRGEIQARQGLDSQRLQLERQDVLAGLLGAIEMAKERQDPASMIRGYVELARLMGFYPATRSVVEVSAVAPTADMGRFEAMSDAELLAMVAG